MVPSDSIKDLGALGHPSPKSGSERTMPAGTEQGLQELSPGDHCCGIFTTRRQEHEVVARYIRDGLVAGDRVLYVADDGDRDATLAEVAGLGIDVPRVRSEGRLEVDSATSVYLPRGRFDPDAMLERLDEAKKSALDDGFARLRATGDMAWATASGTPVEDLLAYEARLNRLVAGSHLQGICQYDLERFPADLLLSVLATHPKALMGHGLHDNFYYTPPDEFLGPGRHAAILQRWMRNLEERTRLEAERDRAEAERRELERQRTIGEFRRRFLNMASHELRTPMTPIRLQVDLLRRDGTTSPQQQQRLDILARNARRLDSLVMDLLEVSRLESGRFPVRPQDTALAPILEAVVEDYKPAAEQKGVVLEAHIEPVVAHVDAGRLQQVASNLVENAIRFTPAGGHVRLACGRHDDGVLLRVQDEGAGLDTGQIERLFQPFTRLHDHLEGPQRGSGLGLYIVRTIVEQHGGRVRAESPGPGKGTTFEVLLPRAGAARGPEVPQDGQPLQDAQSS